MGGWGRSLVGPSKDQEGSGHSQEFPEAPRTASEALGEGGPVWEHWSGPLGAGLKPVAHLHVGVFPLHPEGRGLSPRPSPSQWPCPPGWSLLQPSPRPRLVAGAFPLSLQDTGIPTLLPRPGSVPRYHPLPPGVLPGLLQPGAAFLRGTCPQHAPLQRPPGSPTLFPEELLRPKMSL